MTSQINALESEFFIQLRRFKHFAPTQDMMPDGITPNEGFALKMIELCEKGSKPGRPSVIAEHLHASKSSTSQILRSLGEKGLITREQSKEDFRVATLGLTEAGNAVVAKMDELCEERFRQVISDFGIDNFQTLVSLLDKLADCMEASRQLRSRSGK